MTHTQGPWKAIGNEIRPVGSKGSTGGYAPILIAHHDKRLPDNRSGNAILAAAAPELLAALQWVVKQIPEPSLPGEYTTGYASMIAAIAKATGGTK